MGTWTGVRRVVMRIENDDGTVYEREWPSPGGELLQVELSEDTPPLLAGATENGVQKRKLGPVTFAQLAVVVRHRG